MGLIDAGYNNYMPNATKCTTFNDIKRSHQGKNQTVIIEVNDIYGMLIVIAKLDVDKQGAVPKSQKNEASTVHSKPGCKLD